MSPVRLRHGWPTAAPQYWQVRSSSFPICRSFGLRGLGDDMIPPVPYRLVKVFAWSCQPSLRPYSTLRMVLSYSQRSAVAKMCESINPWASPSQPADSSDKVPMHNSIRARRNTVLTLRATSSCGVAVCGLSLEGRKSSSILPSSIIVGLSSSLLLVCAGGGAMRKALLSVRGNFHHANNF
jgi:hypothetical protein